jgi:L-fuconolactonase
MDIFDAHHHLWDPRRLRYELLEPLTSIYRPFLAADYDEVAQRNGIRCSIVVEAAMAGADGISETNWLLSEAAKSDRVRGTVIWAPIESAGLGRYLDSLKQRNVVGVRRALEREPAGFARRHDVIGGVRLLGRYGLAFDLVLPPELMPDTIFLARACPEVQFVLDHLGKPDVRGGNAGTWRAALREFAELPNVACKISGLVTEAGPDWKREDLEPYVLHAIECFGWSRVLFGTDWPVSLLAGGVERWLDALLCAVRDASGEELTSLLMRNAARTYRIRTTVEADDSGARAI